MPAAIVARPGGESKLQQVATRRRDEFRTVQVCTRVRWARHSENLELITKQIIEAQEAAGSVAQQMAMPFSGKLLRPQSAAGEPDGRWSRRSDARRG